MNAIAALSNFSRVSLKRNWKAATGNAAPKQKSLGRTNNTTKHKARISIQVDGGHDEPSTHHGAVHGRHLHRTRRRSRVGHHQVLAMSNFPPTHSEWQMVSIMQRQRKELDELRDTLKTIITCHDLVEQWPNTNDLREELAGAIEYARRIFLRVDQ